MSYIAFSGGINGGIGFLVIVALILLIVWGLQRLGEIILRSGLKRINGAYVDLRRSYTLDVTQLSQYAQESEYFRGKSTSVVYRCGYDVKSCLKKSDEFLVVTQEMVDKEILRPIRVETSSLT